MASCTRAASSGAGPAGAPRPSVVDIFRRHGDIYRAAHPQLTPEQGRLLSDMMVCRTAVLGGHVYVCDECGYELPVYNSCRNRNCPSCQALDQARWLEARKARILPVGHHHVVFTLPGQLRALARQHPREVFNLLMTAVRETLTDLPREHLGLQLGVTVVLHTWTRELLFHPHVHGIVTAGGLSLDGTCWVERKNYLLHVAQMKAYFRARVLHHLDQLRQQDELGLGQAAWKKLLASLPKPKRWCVHIQKPFGRSAYVLDYLGRYTHRIALSDHRLVDVHDDAVRFRTRGDDIATLTPLVFMERYMQHVLPRGLHKIRHFGLYAAVNVRCRLPVAHALLGEGDQNRLDEPRSPPAEETAVELMLRLTGENLLRCPHCSKGRMERRPLPRGAPRPPPSRQVPA